MKEELILASIKSKEQRKNDFLIKLKQKYTDYTLISDYENADTFILLKHKNGYIWKTKPRYLDGRQCKEIAIHNRRKKQKLSIYTTEYFKERFYNIFDKNEYEVLGEYINTYTKIKIKHLKCGKTFSTLPDALIDKGRNKKGCPYCYAKRTKSLKEINVLLSNRNDLKSYKAINKWTKNGHTYCNFIHNCSKCNNYQFTMRLSDMLSVHKQRCPRCSFMNQESKAVKEIKKFLSDHHINYQCEKKFKSCKYKNNLRFDFYFPDKNILLEYDGKQHFEKLAFITDKEFKHYQNRDIIKNLWCYKNNITLIRIKYSENHILRLKDIIAQYKLS